MKLRGNCPAKVDEKGRLKIPAVFLEELKEYGTSFYITSPTGDSVESLERDRRQAGGNTELKREAAIPDADQLLRSSGGIGWSRKSTVAGNFA